MSFQCRWCSTPSLETVDFFIYHLDWSAVKTHSNIEWIKSESIVKMQFALLMTPLSIDALRNSTVQEDTAWWKSLISMVLYVSRTWVLIANISSSLAVLMMLMVHTLIQRKWHQLTTWSAWQAEPSSISLSEQLCTLHQQIYLPILHAFLSYYVRTLTFVKVLVYNDMTLCIPDISKPVTIKAKTFKWGPDAMPWHLLSSHTPTLHAQTTYLNVWHWDLTCMCLDAICCGIWATIC